MTRIIAALALALAFVGCVESDDVDLLEGDESAPGMQAEETANAKEPAAGDEQHAEEPASDDSSDPARNVTSRDEPEPEPTPEDPNDEQPPTETAPQGPPATSKSQMSYIFLAHPDDEIASWSTIEQSSGNYHVFVLLTRGGHTGYCENPNNKPGQDNYDASPRDSELCKANRITSFHRFLNRAAQTDPYLDDLDATTPVLSDTDATVGRYDVWAGEHSARVIFDLPDGGLDAGSLVAANELVRSLKGAVLPDLPDYQALAGSFWNKNYPDCIVYDHPDHRAVHVGVYQNDLDTTVQRGRTCATDPDATYFRTVSDVTWTTMAGDPNYLAEGGEPGIYRRSYGWLSPGWVMSVDDASSIISKEQSFWERRF